MIVDRIDEWFENPVFEPDPDEKWEELATSRYGPLRLAANVVLNLDARIHNDAHPVRLPRPRLSRVIDRRPGLSRALDRWADKEIETQTRLERLVLPSRWRG